jgi:hypothetical protein
MPPKIIIPTNNPNPNNYMMGMNPMMITGNPAYYNPRMPTPYMMYPPGYSPIQPNTFFPQTMGMQSNYNPMNYQKPPVQQQTTVPTTTTTTTTNGSSKFSIDAPIFTPKIKGPTTTTTTTGTKETTNQKEPIESKENINKQNLKEKETFVEPTKTISETPAPVEEKIPEKPIVTEEVDKTQKEQPQQQTIQNKPAEQVTQPAKKGLGNLFGKGPIVKVAPTVVQPVITAKPVVKKNEYLTELQKKAKKQQENQQQQQRQPVYEKYEKKVNKPKEVPKETYVEVEEEEPEPVKEEVKEPEEKWEVVRTYFKISDKKKEETTKRKLDVDFLMHFKDWKISKETLLIEELLKDHIERMKEYTDEFPKVKGDRRDRDRDNKYSNNKKPYERYTKPKEPEPTPNVNINTKEEPGFSRQTTIADNKAPSMSIGGFARKNLDAENKEAEDHKKTTDEVLKINPVKDDLTMQLNVLTLDNYKDTKQKIFETIKDSIESQEKLIDVLFKKAIVEWTYVVIYSKLCYDLDKELPQRAEVDSKTAAATTTTGKKQTVTSVFRSKLLEKCKKVFKEELANFYVKCEDPEEREVKMKQFTLGNVNFIGELINTKILSKKVVFQCVEHLIQNKSDPINLEGIVILLDKFGTFINKDEKLKQEELKHYNEKVNSYLETINYIQENDKKLPGYVRYKIINLIDKRDRGWIESKVDSSKIIKSKGEVSEEYDQEMREKGEIKETISKKNIDYDRCRKSVNEDLEVWKASTNHEHFDWTNVEKITKKHGLGTFLKSFSDAIIDAIGRTEDVENAFSYLKTIVQYYSKNIYKEDKTEIVNVTLNYLEYLSDYILDNHYLLEIWAKIVMLLNNYNLFSYKDLEKLNNLNDDQIDCITTVCVKSVIEAGESTLIDELLKISFFKANKKLLLDKYESLNTEK